MKSINPNHLTLGAAILTLGIGAFVAGRTSAPSGDDTADSHASAMRQTKSPHAGRSGSALSRSHRAASRTARHGAAEPGSGRGDTPASERMTGILAQVDPLDRTRSWVEFLDRLSADEFNDVIVAFRENGVPGDRMDEYAMLLSAWAKLDPLSALDYASANTGSPFARQTILATWSTTDPEAAIRWAEANHDGDGANPWLVGVIRGLASADPIRATELMNSLPYSRERGDALSAMLPTILAMGPEATRNWVSSLPDERLRAGAMDRVVDQIAKTDPQGTIDWMLSNPGRTTDRKIDDVFSRWINADQGAAVACYQNLPAGGARSNALRGIVNSMASDDPRAAANFLESHSTDANDHVYEQFAWHSFRQDPALAADYIGRIENQKDRDKMYSRALDSWLRRDEPAALAWMRSNTLPDPVVKRLEREMQRRRDRQQ